MHGQLTKEVKQETTEEMILYSWLRYANLKVERDFSYNSLPEATTCKQEF